MAQCERCGNSYDKAFEVVLSQGERHTFDSFECAASTLAPRCFQCGTRILGHGMESGDRTFCCANCARMSGVDGMQDHV